MTIDKSSFVSANSFPEKLIRDYGQVLHLVKNGFVMPRHVQLNPTNVCNLDCSFCSCANRKKSDNLSFDRMKDTLSTFRSWGCCAATITGGGEPLLYPRINDTIRLLKEIRIEIGLVTNGTQFKRLESDAGTAITWCRISCSDDRQIPFEEISGVVEQFPNIDWAFSYVVTKEFNPENFSDVVRFANEHNFTHVRAVTDILNEDAPSMDRVKNVLVEAGVNDNLVIYQPRNSYEQGRKKCLVSLLRPVISADGKIYPCCGVQYAKIPSPLDYDDSMMMGTIEEVNRIWGHQEYFNGSVCAKCYYGDYNRTLSAMSVSGKHEAFV